MRRLCVLIALLYVGQCLAAPTKKSSVHLDPELSAGHFEGDIVLDAQRNGLKSDSYRWPNNLVYYTISYDFDQDHRNYILRGMRIIEELSCVRFKEALTYQPYYVNITGNGGGCYSHVGWSNTVRRSNLEIHPLDTGCFRMGSILHEILHTLGFYHMQSSPDRDDYVQIAAENVIQGHMFNFDKVGEEKAEDFGEEYDYGSVMHYSAYAFSKNGERTIVPSRPEEASGIMGQRRGMSQSDILKLNRMYRCNRDL